VPSSSDIRGSFKEITHSVCRKFNEKCNDIPLITMSPFTSPYLIGINYYHLFYKTCLVVNKSNQIVLKSIILLKIIVFYLKLTLMQTLHHNSYAIPQSRP
jgi:hypothetical protein